MKIKRHSVITFSLLLILTIIKPFEITAQTYTQTNAEEQSTQYSVMRLEQPQSVITIRQAETSSATENAETLTVQPPPPAPPDFLRVAEPIPAPTVREPQLLPVNPIPETPSRMSSMMDPIRDDRIPTRLLNGATGQLVEINFSGNNWVYLGEAQNQQGITFNSKRITGERHTFLFRSDIPGVYTLRFYRQDFIEDRVIHENVQLTINGHAITAPEEVQVTYPSFEFQSHEPEVFNIIVDYMAQAEEAFTAELYAEAISFLEQFQGSHTDLTLWIYAQSYEADSPARNIRAALNYYRRLLREFPQSTFGTEAQRRIAHIERFFFNIR